jgi:hypothetical protein
VQHRDAAGGCSRGQGRDAVEQVFVKPDYLGGPRVAGGRQVESQRQHALGDETLVDGLQAGEAADEQTRPDDEDDAEGDLGGHQPAAPVATR